MALSDAGFSVVLIKEALQKSGRATLGEITVHGNTCLLLSVVVLHCLLLHMYRIFVRHFHATQLIRLLAPIFFEILSVHALYERVIRGKLYTREALDSASFPSRGEFMP